MMVFAAGALRIPAPITKEEMDYLKRSVAAKKAAKTRKANVAKRKAAKQQKPRVIVGGKA
jgi:hypothetical protein